MKNIGVRYHSSTAGQPTAPRGYQSPVTAVKVKDVVCGTTSSSLEELAVMVAGEEVSDNTELVGDFVIVQQKAVQQKAPYLIQFETSEGESISKSQIPVYCLPGAKVSAMRIAVQNKFTELGGIDMTTESIQIHATYRDQNGGMFGVCRQLNDDDMISNINTSSPITARVGCVSLQNPAEVTQEARFGTNANSETSAKTVRVIAPQSLSTYLLGGGVGGSIVGAITSTILSSTTDISPDLVFSISVPSGIVLGLLIAGFAYYKASGHYEQIARQ